MKVIRREPEPGETCFGGGCGAIIPFRIQEDKPSTNNPKEEPKPQPPSSEQLQDPDWGFSPIPFDAFPASDPDPEVMETLRREVVKERRARRVNVLIPLQIKNPIDLYYAGDSIGAMAEGATPGAVSFEKAITGLQAFPSGTDESDTARLFLRYCSEVGTDNFDVLGWYAYHTRNRAATSYGKTWRDHFSTVEYILKKNGQLDYDHLLRLSKDRGSNGNGCLALAYPIATLFGEKAQAVAEQVTAATHIMAVQTMRIAVDFFQGKKTLDEVIAESFPQHRTDLWDLTPLSHACLCAAASVARKETMEDVIRLALAKGGDVDSYLALGLLMNGTANRD